MSTQDIYTTESGDTWDSISFKVYGDCRYMAALLVANQSLRRTAVFESGVEIICPDIEVSEAENLPPWAKE